MNVLTFKPSQRVAISLLKFVILSWLTFIVFCLSRILAARFHPFSFCFFIIFDASEPALTFHMFICVLINTI